jgi:phosphopantothenoylcysteine decarboxylase / phosphopantothenate---cysteine ligase
VLITAGPTYEHIDPVRFIGNHSSGKMGVAIAREFLSRGADVTLVLGPTELPFDLEGMAVINVNTAQEMYDACITHFDASDITVMAAAVADYTPISVAVEKIKKKDDTLQIDLRKTKDILKSLGERKRSHQVLAGFALETNNEKENALQKIKQKNADIIVLNSLRDKDAGFGKNTNKVTIFDKEGNEKSFGVKAKEQVAHDIVDFIIQYSHA